MSQNNLSLSLFLLSHLSTLPFPSPASPGPYYLFFTIEILRSLYERIRLPVVPLYGGFPVKLRTFVGEPIPYDPNTTAEQLTAKVRSICTYIYIKNINSSDGKRWNILVK